MNRFASCIASLAVCVLLAAPALSRASTREPPGALPTVPQWVDGCLTCGGGEPLTNCTVTLQYWDSNGIVNTGTVVTDSTGCFKTIITCAESNNIDEHWVITASCCPSNSWTIPTNTCGQQVLPPLICGDCTGCASPPANMVGWWQLDEATPGISADMAGGNTCAWVGSPTINATQYVGKSVTFPSASSYLNCPTPNGIEDVGTGDFSIDAWIKSADLTENYRTILDHRQLVAFGPSMADLKPVGFSLYTTYGFLGLQMADGTASDFTYYLPKVIDGNWHHVAATVQRTVANGGVKLYVDGVPQFTNFDPTPRSLTLTNNGPIRIGQAYNNTSAAFAGSIDEVEIFKRALTGAEVAKLANVGTRGKCKDACYLPWDVAMCANKPSAATNLTICNYSTAPVTYTYGFAGLPVGPGCQVPGPTGFTPPTGTVTVAGGACVNVPVVIANPGIPGTNVACYRATVTNTTTGRVFHCDGSVQGSPCTPLTWTISGTIAVELPAATMGTSLVFLGGNSTTTPIDVDVKIDAMPADMSPVEAIVSLNGLPPGEPVFLTVHLEPGQTVEVPVACAFSQWDPFMAHSVMLETDLDGDGVMEAVTSFLVYQGSATPVAVGGGPGRTPLGSVAVSPAPFRDRLDIRFTLDAASPVRVEVWDVSGRLVRTLRHGTLPAGSQHLTWDGHLTDGRVAGPGLYLVRVQAGSRVLSAKVLRTP